MLLTLTVATVMCVHTNCTLSVYYTGNKNDLALLSKSNFSMIKYPRKGHSIPHERVFKMDFENMVCAVQSFAAFIMLFLIVNNVAPNRKFKI